MENITVDLVYGTYTPSSCDEEIRLTKKTSTQFKQTIYARKTEGAPGYLKGSNIMIGKAVSTDNGTFIDTYQGGFQVRGADN